MKMQSFAPSWIQLFHLILHFSHQRSCCIRNVSDYRSKMGRKCNFMFDNKAKKLSKTGLDVEIVMPL